MKISLEWLRDYVDIRQKPERLKEDLALSGLVAESFSRVADDVVFDFEVTSNRPDCLSHVGVAREVAARYRRPLRLPPGSESLTAAGPEVPYGIEIRDPDLCPRYTGLVLDGVEVRPSPPWLERRLVAAGMRPLNNVVDVTNYVLLELGHPLHAFDYHRLRGGKIVVARAAPGTKMTTLDGVVRGLDPEMLLINDGERPVAIAGVMGGLDSEISESTRTVLLECAYFDPRSVRRTSKRLGLLTEAAYRFERGADWNDTVTATARACRLLQEVAGARVAGSLQDVYPTPLRPVVIELRRRNAENLLGVRLTDRFVVSTLERLEFKPEPAGKGIWQVSCPSFRADMELEADLIEELARFRGYDKIPTTVRGGGAGTPSPARRIENAARGALLGVGYHEAVNLSFAADSELQQFPGSEGAPVPVSNPLTEETRFLRTTLAAGLVKSVKHNFNHDNRLVRLFEIGHVFGARASGEVEERRVLGMAATGGFAGANWANPAGATFFHLKGALEAVLAALRSARWEVLPGEGVPWLDPAGTARLVVAGETLGVLGPLHPALEEQHKLRQRVFLAEIEFDRLAPHLFRPVTFEPLPRYPAVERDLSVLVGADAEFREIAAGIEQLGISELVALDLIDVYEGGKIPAGKRSMTLRLRFQDRARTLTIDQVQAFGDNVLTFLRKKFGAELR